MSEIEIKNQKNTELGLLPKDWNIYKVKDVADTKAGGTPSRKVKEYYDGTIPWVKSGELEDNFINDTEEKLSEEALSKSSAKLFPQGSLLIAMYGATVGKTALLNITASTNQAICAIFPNNKLLYNPYLRYYFIFARDRLLTERYGGAQSNISQTLIRNFKIPLPPLPEQKKIAAILSRVQEAKERTEAVIDATKALKKSMMKHLFTYGPVTKGKLNAIKDENAKHSIEWKVSTIKNFVESTEQKDIRNTTEKYKYIDVSSIDRELLSIVSYKQVKGKNAPSRAKKIINENDVLIATIRPGLKRIAIVPSEFDKQVCSTAFCVLRSKKNVLDSKFLYYYIQQSNFLDSLISLERGASYPAITDKDVKQQEIFYPILDEQKEIAAILQVIDEKIYEENNKLKSYNKLFHSLLKNLMTGKLRVNNLDIPL